MKNQNKTNKKPKRLVNVMRKRSPFMAKFAETRSGFGHSRGSR